MTRYAIVVDLNRCVGCQTCTAACKHANATLPGVQWRKVLDFETGDFPDVRRAFLPVGCMHCDEPPCMEVCPSTATRKRDDGIVTIDYDICLGCAYCAVACPYQARFKVTERKAAYGKAGRMRHEDTRFDPAMMGVAQKCTFCVDRIDQGIAAGLTPGIDPEATPACVFSCISGALSFGDLDDDQSNVSRLLREHRSFDMHAELGTGPNIHYLYEGAASTNAEKSEDTPTPELQPDTTGLAAVSPRLQTNWDWRAAGNFIFGGTGTGLFAASSLAGLSGLFPRLAALAGLALVALGLFCVWLEIGRPWRFLNVYRNARTSWMTREALAAILLFALGLPAIWFASTALGLVAAAVGLFFLYAQGRILRAAKGIPAWRHRRLLPVILATGLTEGAGLFVIGAALGGGGRAIIWALAVLLVLRFAAWYRYRHGLGAEGAPVETLRALDRNRLALGWQAQLAVLGLVALALFWPAAGLLAGLGAMLTGWRFKFGLITRAAFTQGYAINRMPARGAGTSAPGVKPGWTREDGQQRLSA